MAHSSRSWSGARTPQALKRVRQSARRHTVLQRRRSTAKTEVKQALAAAASGDSEATELAIAAAASALDRAAKTGAIHPNNAARRKSRLVRHATAALGGTHVQVARPQRQVSKAAAAKAAKARIAAGKATKAKGEQTAAGKARAALTRSARASSESKSGRSKAGGTKTSAKAASSKAPKTATPESDES